MWWPGPIRRLSQSHATITNSYSYSWIRNRVVLELWVIITNKHTNSARKFPGDFANFQNISSISRRENNSSRFPGFPGVLDTLNMITDNRWCCRCQYDLNGSSTWEKEETARATSHHVTEHRPARSENSQHHTKWSSQPDSEPSWVEAHVYVWHYALLVVHARTEVDRQHINTYHRRLTVGFAS